MREENKMNKKSFFVITLMLTVLILSACGKKIQEPRLSLEYNDEQLKVIHYGDRYNKTQEDIEKQLKDYMIGKKFEELPIIPFNEEIIIENTNFDVDEYEIYDFILDKRGNIISDFNTAGSVVGKYEDNKAYFKFIDTVESRKYEDYAIDNKNIHCLLIKCKIGKSEFAFATLILDSKE